MGSPETPENRRWARLLDLRLEDIVEGTEVEWRDGRGNRGTLTFGPRVESEPSPFLFEVKIPDVD